MEHTSEIHDEEHRFRYLLGQVARGIGSLMDISGQSYRPHIPQLKRGSLESDQTALSSDWQTAETNMGCSTDQINVENKGE